MTKPTLTEQIDRTTSTNVTRIVTGEIIDVPAHVANELTVFERDPGLRETYTLLINEIPESTAEDAAARILRQILNAETPEEVNAIWESTGLMDKLDRPLRITKLRRRPSDFKGLGAFLIAEATDESTGEELVITTGAANALGALIKAYVSDWLPAKMVFRGEPVKSNPGATVVVPEFLAVRVGR